MNLTEFDVEQISKSSLFKSISTEEILELSESTGIEIKEYKAGEDIFKEKSIETSMFLIIRGNVEILITKSNGLEDLITILSINDFFGEMAFITGEPRSATARARVPSRLLKIDYRDFINSSKIPEFSKTKFVMNISSKLALRLTKLNNDYLRLLNMNKDYFNDMSPNLVSGLSSEISMIKNRYLG